MSIKASVSISEQQEAFARKLVSEGRYASLSAVVQRGLELLREDIDVRDAELELLRSLLDERRAEAETTIDEGRKRTDSMIASRRDVHRL